MQLIEDYEDFYINSQEVYLFGLSFSQATLYLTKHFEVIVNYRIDEFTFFCIGKKSLAKEFMALLRNLFLW